MQWELLDSKFDSETGISKVVVKTELGVFEGTSKLHEEDKDIKSIFQGCRYAEIRAMIKYGKAKARAYKNKVDILKEVIDNMEKLNNYQKNSVEARFIRKQYFIKLDTLNQLNLQIKALENGLYNQMKNYRQERENFMKKIKNDMESQNK